MIRAHYHVRREALKPVVERLHEEAHKPQGARTGSVGIHEDEGNAAKDGYDGSPGNATLMEVATAHEFGRGTVPDRSFLRTWFDSNLARIKREMLDAKRAERAGEEDAVRKQVADWAEELRAWITSANGGLEPLSAGTIARRQAEGLDAGPPLFATGQLAEAIRGMVDEEYIE